MIPIELLKKVNVVYTHAHCPDGMASAMILQDAFRMLDLHPRIEFLDHNTPEHRAAGMFREEGGEDFVLFCDIAPHEAAATATRLGGAIVLDHHAGTQEMVESFGERGVYADAETEPGVSGAVLAFREVWKLIFHSEFKATGMWPNPVDLVGGFAACVGARDTWRTDDSKFERGQWISKMLMSKPAAWWLEGQMRVDDPIPKTLRYPRAYLTEAETEAGRALFEAHEEAVRQAVWQVVMFDVSDTSTGVFRGGMKNLYVFQEQASGFRLTSDVAEALRGAVHYQAIVAGFSYVVDKPGGPPKLLYSLRGLNGFDVCAFAKANGGGGHKAAAGFAVEIRKLGGGVVVTDPYQEISERLIAFLYPQASLVQKLK